MKRILYICFLAMLCWNMYAQETQTVYYVLENGFSGSNDIAGTTYKSGDTILLRESCSFYFQRIRNGQISTEHVSGKLGSFEVDSLYRIAQNERRAKRNNKASNVSKSASQYKGTDSTLYRFTGKIARLSDAHIPSITEYGSIEFKKDGQKIFVKNTSENDDMFVDIIWIRNGLCMSAISFSRDFANNKVIYPGETIECMINEYVTGERLFVVCTPWPIEYNTIDLKQALEQDLTYDMDIPLTMYLIADE